MLPANPSPPGASLSWATLDWPRLDRLRAKFLARAGGQGSYWTSREDLANYDFTYAQRIGWKWDAVLRELDLRGWQPPPGPLLDWGCGSGIAGRRVAGCYGAERFGTLRVFDRSQLAMNFALERACQELPGLTVVRGETAGPARAGGTVVVSHVLNELDASGTAALRAVIDAADAVLWVEPGTYADSRALIAWRELLREQFMPVAPCTHRRECGMLHAPNAAHWCHHFAAPPPGLLADADWVRFGQHAGIDLRSIPYSFLVLERPGARANGDPNAAPVFDGWSRVIGQPRLYKGFAKILDCSAEDVRETGVQQRDNPALFRAVKKGRTPTLLHGTPDAKGWKIVDEMR